MRKEVINNFFEHRERLMLKNRKMNVVAEKIGKEPHNALMSKIIWFNTVKIIFFTKK